MLAAHISDAAVRVFVGVITIAFVLYTLIRALQIPREAPRPSVPAGVFWGALSGFTSTICQAGGPPYQIYVLALQLRKMSFVGTTRDFFASMNWLKVVPYVALGQFSGQGLGTSLVLLPLALATNVLGFWLVRARRRRCFTRSLRDVPDLARAGAQRDAGDCMRGMPSARPCLRILIRKPGSTFRDHACGKQQWRKRPTTPISTATRPISSR